MANPHDKAIEAACVQRYGVHWKDLRPYTRLKLREMLVKTIAAYERAMWRPIKEAPKDGTIIDVWLGDAEPADIDFYCTPGTRRSCGWSWRDGKFRPLGGLSVTMSTFVQPTHFRPLPPVLEGE